ncbi:MAG: hypothetical protein GY820_12560, partial [Gammaproteobacteria bacterium]|nr:hypothetical protein [Gammaproteobacteria bacterium]
CCVGGRFARTSLRWPNSAFPNGLRPGALNGFSFGGVSNFSRSILPMETQSRLPTVETTCGVPILLSAVLSEQIDSQQVICATIGRMQRKVPKVPSRRFYDSA